MSRPCGRPSISAKIVAPVVVKPDAASKTASVTEAVDVSTNGSPPAKLATIQQMPTTANPSRKVRFRGVCERLVYASASPPPTMITSDESRPRKAPSPYHSDTPSGSTSDAPTHTSSTPTINRTERICMAALLEEERLGGEGAPFSRKAPLPLPKPLPIPFKDF